MRARLAVLVAVATTLSFAAPLGASAETTEPAATAATLLNELRVEAPATVPYDRDLFNEGQDLDGDGCRTRQEVLIAESLAPVTSTGRCTITAGQWRSPYDGATYTDPARLEMDHLVALKETWVSGASSWTPAQRQAYANDTEFPATLVMVTSAVNTAKSDKDPASWLPPLESARCQYVSDWVSVKWRWNLSVDPAEKTAIQSVIDGCGGQHMTVSPQPAEEASTMSPAPGVTGTAPFAAGVTRLAGDDRYGTAIAVARHYDAGVPALFVATGSDFPDALSAAAAASLVGGPLLLTTRDRVPASVLAEVSRLAPRQIYVIGGPSAVSDAALASLSSFAPTTRLGGANRYETGLTIVSTTFAEADQAFIATGRSFPDALAATGAAGAAGAPVILVDGTSPTVPAGVLATLSSLGVQSIAIAGGTSVVSPGIAHQLADAGFAVTRLGGSDRYATAALINDASFPAGSTDTSFMATGGNFPDALAGAALAGLLRAPLYVTTAGCSPDAIRASVTRLAPSKRIVMGGTSVVSDAAAANLGCLAVGTPSISGSAEVNATLTANPGSWTSGTAFSYQWLGKGAAIAGATGRTLTLGTNVAGQSVSVRVTGSNPGFVGATRDSAGVRVGYPTHTAPVSSWDCPAWAPIKGNADSGIYHVPGGRYYASTHPEECFATRAAAEAAGYRASKQ